MRPWMPLGILLIAALLLSSCSDPNMPPVIDTLTASTTSVFVGNDVRLKLSAFDPEGQPLKVSWYTGEGSLVSISDTEAIWQATIPGLHPIQVEVTDVYGASVRGTLEIRVSDHLILPAGTEVQLELLREVRGDAVRIGDRLPLRVVESVSIEGYQVIEAGAFGIGQVLEVQLPGGATQMGRIVLTPTRLQLVDGQVVTLDAGRESSRPIDSNLPGSVTTVTLSGTTFEFESEQSVIVRSGARLTGVLRDDARLSVQRNELVASEAAQPALVTTAACLGIHGTDFSEYVISVFSDGVRVEGFQAGSSAAQSGIQVGDRITGVRTAGEEYPIANLTDLARIERTLQPGDRVTLMVRNLLRRAEVPLVVDTCYVIP